MTIAAILEVLTAFFKFPDAVVRLVRALQKTPEQQHEDLVTKMETEAKNFEDTGRPSE